MRGKIKKVLYYIAWTVGLIASAILIYGIIKALI